MNLNMLRYEKYIARLLVYWCALFGYKAWCALFGETSVGVYQWEFDLRSNMSDEMESSATDLEFTEKTVEVDNISMLDLETAYESSADEPEDDEDAPSDILRQRGAASARIRRLFGIDTDEIPDKPLIQDDSNFIRKMYWSHITDSGFPNRVNHAVAAHR